MRQQILKFISFHRRELVIVAINILIVITLLLFSNQIIVFGESFSIKKDHTVVETAIKQELDSASKQREEIISSNNLNNAIESKDFAQLIAITQSEAKKRELSSIVVTDNDGFVLVRSHIPDQRGDNIFHTTAHGRRIYKGETITASTRGSRSPMILVSASPVLVKDKTIGGIYVGYAVNNIYANYFKEKYLNKDSNVAFYTLREGVIGDSFNDKDKTRLVNTYFSLGSDVVTQNIDILSKEIKIGNNYYIVHHLVFPGIEQSPGGVFIFSPVYHGTYGLLFATITIFLFLILYYLTIFLFRSMHSHKHNKLILILSIVILFSVVYFFTIFKLNQSASEIKKTPYIIYNSTMKFDPESDVISQFSEKTIAIKIFTGGEAINVVRAVIQYDPSLVNVVDILTTNSLCDPEGFLDREIDNEIGRVKITCYTPNINPGFYEPEGIVAELVIKPLAQGEASLKFVDRTQVLASDGLETNVLRKSVDAFYQITNQKLTTVNLQEKIPIFSPNHKNSNRWYQNKKIQLAWPLLKDAVYYYAFTKDPDFIPNNNDFSTVNNYIDLSAENDGIYYFHLRATDKEGKSGPISHFKIMLDTAPPLKPKIKVSDEIVKKGNIVRFNFTSEDALSGLQSGFYVSIDEGVFLPVAPPFYIPFLKSGDYPVVIRAFDKANNFSDSQIIIHVSD